MNLQELLYKVSVLKVVGTTNIEVLDIAFDSRKVKVNSLFIAVKGTQSDGHTYISQTIKAGVSVIVLEDMPADLDDKTTYIQVEDSSIALGIIAANFYENPSGKLKLVGITGTNGKTTIVSLLSQIFTLLNVKVGMLSTIQNKIIDEVIPSTHTTPDALHLNFLLNRMIKEGCKYCFMEVSSHAIAQGRISGLNFSGGIFTNITQDHLDYHNTFTEYRDVKKSFFDILPKSAFALSNKDDKNGMKMLEGTKAKKCTYALKSVADYKCRVLENQFEGLLLNINKVDVSVKLIGDFNAYNMLSVYAVTNLFDFEDNEVLTALSMLTAVEGRFQYLQSKEKITAIVDYAHTDDALKNVISTINNIRSNSEQLITVVGCGGDRDKTKRPLMAAVACNLSNQVILTADNPRSESPNAIIEDMLEGLDLIQKKKVLVITDRAQAIKTACRLANTNDIVLVSGKGHEKYQEINGEKFPFDDLEELKQSLNIIIQ
ncbi:MAG: UDP-N-acetylmuramoyl-L-alanyl-D-glutamate--2,6-diaminopimelate ligase [Flavobacteriales bacterium]|jgi:UDP-N-acetylmuramoyl-L-alanyl-D-glutamate--2,6-diaminopimelate ligase|nr:UDP-N-acetylmuramoyl-L-alanyl-D-glutamate--2,6-diaminopimelate ligase [Flavobacteriales bacterium]MBT5090059.1 UDP-N-acetylmuramoyl-L-alanyl-D-glutamate--2,6-diaminopimelate ligase [Flavobacteriales bacterium]MBT5750144.1 UDP-N-acetylmuramoyl-L-alanyl-D-glutamate--2,6-diaminopimelate ligase [Flavobacteriales bacterium]